MMRALLFLGLVGAAIYGFLVLTDDALSEGNSKDRVAIQSQPNHPEGERLSSWDTYLPSPSTTQSQQLATNQQPALLPPQENNKPRQNPGRYQVAASGNSAAPSESEGVKPGSALGAETAEPTTQPMAAKPALQKPSKRSESFKRRTTVAAADPWNGRWAQRAERRRGLFMFRPIPNGRY